MLRLGEVDHALCGGVSESTHTFGIFASFKSRGALAHHDDATKASRRSIKIATASSSPKGAAYTSWSVSTTPGVAAPKSTANSSAMR